MACCTDEEFFVSIKIGRPFNADTLGPAAGWLGEGGGMFGFGRGEKGKL
jgi:hypothetical protein